jgi:hypothetical protein
VVKWQNIKIKDLQQQVLSLVERNQNLERKQLVMARQALMVQANAHGSHGVGDVSGVDVDAGGVSAGVGVIEDNTALMSTARMRRQLEEMTREQARISSLLREEKRKNKRNESALMVERDMNRESQRIIEELHREDDGHTSTSS